MNQKTRQSLQIIAVGACALALKIHYSIASPDHLRWILSPTTWLVELLSSQSFHFESHAGYMSSDHSFLIAASCAGVNFMIASFLMLTLRTLLSNRTQSVSWWFIPKAAAIAYLTTLVANTVRICIALEMQKGLPSIDQLNFNQMHRLEGILVYFAFLLMLFRITETAHSKSLPARVRQLSFPLSIYYVTTLLLPFLNGASRYSQAFWEHSVFVLVVPLFVSLFLLALTWLVDIRQRKMRLRN